MNSKNPHSIFILSGEASGDLHAANMVKELNLLHPDLKIQGWGGDKMSKEGVEILKHYQDLAFMGFWEVVKNIFEVFRNFKLVKSQINALNPKLVILVDYPGFNLRLLPWLKENRYVVIYYIAPQAWAWKENRVKKMAKYIDKLCVILPFEYEFFRSRGVQTEFVGHPILQTEIPESEKNNKTIALLPGSRKQEISYILPEMLSALSCFPEYKFVIAGMSHIGVDFYQSLIGKYSATVEMNNSENIIARAQLALVSSGTATLQTAIIGTPLIVCYKTSWINYELGKRLIKVKFISLVNLILNREVVKEIIQSELNSQNLSKEISRLLLAHGSDTILQEFSQLRSILGEKNASRRMAEIVVEYIN